MNKEEICDLAIERGIRYNPETGQTFGVKGKELKPNTIGYIPIRIHFNKKYHSIYAHHFAFYITYGYIVKYIDHINANPSDNRISNLREITLQQNQWNRPTAKGYNWDKVKNKWAAKIVLNQKNIFLGYFDIEAKAREAYLNAKAKYHIIK